MKKSKHINSIKEIVTHYHIYLENEKLIRWLKAELERERHKTDQTKNETCFGIILGWFYAERDQKYKEINAGVWREKQESEFSELEHRVQERDNY